MELRVTYPDWLVGDGDEPVIVGSPWQVTLELQRAGPGKPKDWHPILAPSSAQLSGLWPVGGEPGCHRLVGEVVMDDSSWVGIEVGGGGTPRPDSTKGVWKAGSSCTTTPT